VEPEQSSTENIEELIARSTLSDSIQINVSGQFESERDAQALADACFAILKLGGAYLDLDGLEGISVADDYLTALASVERGFGNQAIAQPTRDEFGNGFGMTLPIRREGVMKSYIVLDSRLCRPLVDPESAAYQFAVHTLLHEAAHVHDHAVQYQCFPGFYGSTIPSVCKRTLTEFALSAWNEYIASRLSAPWGTRDYVSSFEDSLVQMIETARQRGNAAILEHNEHGDVGRTGTAPASIYGSLLTRASYVLGHVEGLGTDLASEAPRWSQLVEQTPWLVPFWAEYRSILSSMYATYGQWTGVDVLNPLKELFQRYLLACGMLLQARPDGECSMYFKRM
jgi:hypothetical protein